jgi:hypothetical protein
VGPSERRASAAEWFAVHVAELTSVSQEEGRPPCADDSLPSRHYCVQTFAGGFQIGGAQKSKEIISCAQQTEERRRCCCVDMRALVISCILVVWDSFE